MQNKPNSTDRLLAEEIITSKHPLFEFKKETGEHVKIFANGKIEDAGEVRFIYNYFYLLAIALLSPTDDSNKSDEGNVSTS